MSSVPLLQTRSRCRDKRVEILWFVAETELQYYLYLVKGVEFFFFFFFFTNPREDKKNEHTEIYRQTLQNKTGTWYVGHLGHGKKNQKIDRTQQNRRTQDPQTQPETRKIRQDKQNR